ncbi:hypothetical protein T484DRAFT_1870209 [Baffinella frigidus]|nr:hypothetical protein T484DRAFT_1870209 [Cryptophyta sp. CCMP2293]
MPHTARSSPKRKHEEVDGSSTPTPPVSTTQTEGDGAKEQKKKCECPYDGCDASRRHPGELQQHVDYEHKKKYHNVCGHIIDEETGAKCGKKCETKSGLTKHKRDHSDVRYKCTVCSKAFKRADVLKRHKRTHSDVRDHECKVCSMAFKDPQARDRHWVSQHSPLDHPARTRHKCTECNMGFPTTSQRTEHYLRWCVPKDHPRRRAFLDRVNKANRALYASDEMVRVKNSLRCALWYMMKKMGMGKVSLSEDLVGCSFEELLAHLNDNVRDFVFGKLAGGVELHIDHIRPMFSFKNLKCQVEVRMCMDFNNLQLLTGPENLSKNKSFTPAQEAVYALSKGGMAIADSVPVWRADPEVCKCEECKGWRADHGVCEC